VVKAAHSELGIEEAKAFPAIAVTVEDLRQALTALEEGGQ